MPKLGTFAARDTVREATVTLVPPGTKERVPLVVGFRPNSLTMEPNAPNGHVPDAWTDEMRTPVSEQAWQNAINFCETVAHWDLEGELLDNQGMVVVDEGEVVPITPQMILYLPTWIVTQVTDRLLDLAFPNRPPSNPVRRR